MLGGLKKILRKLLLTLVWLLFIFALFEGAGYVYFKVLNIKAIGEYGYPNGLFVAHDELDYLYQPGFNGNFSGGDFHDVEININEHGFRDDPFTPKTTTPRLAVIGDSVVFGAGVKKEDRFTELLEKSYNGKLEVYNLGVSSYSFGHYLTLANINFVDLKPDYVLLGFTLNDIERKEDAWPAKRYGKLKVEGQSGKPAWLEYSQKVMGRTYAGRFTRELKTYIRSATLQQQEKEAYHTKWMTTVDGAWRDDKVRGRLFDEIKAFQQAMQTRQIPFSFLLFPELNTLLEPDKFSYPRRELINYLESLHIPYCDPYPVFSSYKGDVHELFLYDDSVHFTSLGHELISNAAADCLKLMGG